MSRSIFDPTGPNTEHSGNQNMGPRADDISHLPADIIDGAVSDEEVAEQDTVSAQAQNSQDATARQATVGVEALEVEQAKLPPG